MILEGDSIVLTTLSADAAWGLELTEMEIEPDSDWIDQPLEKVPLDRNTLVIAVRRQDTFFIPNGKTIFMPGDILVLSKGDTP